LTLRVAPSRHADGGRGRPSSAMTRKPP
jgi:hypothetical protein